MQRGEICGLCTCYGYVNSLPSFRCSKFLDFDVLSVDNVSLDNT